MPDKNPSVALDRGQMLAILSAILAGGSSHGLPVEEVVARYREIGKLLQEKQR